MLGEVECSGFVEILKQSQQGIGPYQSSPALSFTLKLLCQVSDAVCSAVAILCVQSDSERDHSISCCRANHYSYLNLSGFAGGTCPVLGGIPSSHGSGVIFLLTKDTAVQHSSPYPFSLARSLLPRDKMHHIPISLALVLE